eukprot:229500_1
MSKYNGDYSERSTSRADTDQSRPKVVIHGHAADPSVTENWESDFELHISHSDGEEEQSDSSWGQNSTTVSSSSEDSWGVGDHEDSCSDQSTSTPTLPHSGPSPFRRFVSRAPRAASPGREIPDASRLIRVAAECDRNAFKIV